MIISSYGLLNSSGKRERSILTSNAAHLGAHQVSTKYQQHTRHWRVEMRWNAPAFKSLLPRMSDKDWVVEIDRQKLTKIRRRLILSLQVWSSLNAQMKYSINYQLLKSGCIIQISAGLAWSFQRSPWASAETAEQKRWFRIALSFIRSCETAGLRCSGFVSVGQT